MDNHFTTAPLKEVGDAKSGGCNVWKWLTRACVMLVVQHRTCLLYLVFSVCGTLRFWGPSKPAHTHSLYSFANTYLPCCYCLHDTGIQHVPCCHTARRCCASLPTFSRWTWRAMASESPPLASTFCCLSFMHSFWWLQLADILLAWFPLAESCRLMRVR